MGLRYKFFKKLIYLRLFALSLIGALALSLLSLYTILQIADSVVREYRYGYLQYLARKIEKSAEHRSLRRIRLQKIADAGDETYPLIEVTEYKGIKRQERQQPLLWVFSETGKKLASNNPKALPVDWDFLPKPKKDREVVSLEEGFFKPKIFVIKLETTPVSYLVSRNSGFTGPVFWIQGLHTFFTATLAMFFALSFLVFYLRRKSKDATDVLTRLKTGDLKARFKIKRFDEFGSLLLDFNRMADQIESLVKKVNDAESARSNLLAELGHDVRTPLTSLSTSFDTLRAHHEDLSLEDREELYSMLAADIRYFSDLLEKLTLIANINVPKYKSSTSTVDLKELLEEELHSRQTLSKNGIRWTFRQGPDRPVTLTGDPHLMTRLFRNAFDNASRFAHSEVSVSLEQNSKGIYVRVSDDGPGISEEAIASFGKRRQRRQVKERDADNFSLGLGSVIMKTIAEVHDGVVSICNANQDTDLRGACLSVHFKPR